MRKMKERGRRDAKGKIKTAVIREVKNGMLSCSESPTGSVNSVFLLKH